MPKEKIYTNKKEFDKGGWLDSFKPPTSRIEAETKLDALNNRSTTKKLKDVNIQGLLNIKNNRGMINTSEIYQSGVNKGKPTGKGALEETISPIDFIPALDVATITMKGAGMLGKGVLKTLKPLKQEILYKGINPVGYGAKEKIKDFIPNAIKYTIKPNEKVTDIGLKLSSNSINTADDLAKAKIKFNNSKKLTQEEFDALPYEKASKLYSPKEVKNIIAKGENRSDAFRIGLGLNQQYKTFDKIGDDLYRINPEKFNPTKGHLVSLDNDINTFLQKELVYSGEHPGVHLMEKYNKVTSPTIKTPYGEFSINDISNYLKKSGDKTKPWQQTRIVEKSKNPKFENSVYDADQTGIMGSHRWDVKKTSEGNLHYQSNDTWDINPWENRGKINVKNDDLSEALRTKHFKSPLQNIEMLKLMGGKPFNIQNNFIVNPKDYSVIHKFAEGGLLKRADGSYSERGLWDNIRDNRGSNKTPTKQMLEQEKKIKAKYENGGWLDKYENGGEIKDMPFGMPLKEQNPFLVPEYNQPMVGKTILPDVNRPMLEGTNANEFKTTVGTDQGDVQIPTIVGGQYIGENGAWERYKATGEKFKNMTDPRSYSNFYSKVGNLGLMQNNKVDNEIPDVTNAKNYIKEWYNSPMYNNILKNQIADWGVTNPKRTDKILKRLNKNFNKSLDNSFYDVNPTIVENNTYFGKSVPNNKGGREINLEKDFIKNNPKLVNSLFTHELAHDNLMTGMDEKYISKNTPKYNPTISDETKYNFLTDPEEVRSQIHSIRQLSKENKIYDPFTQPFKKEYLDKINKTYNQGTKESEDYNQLQRLRQFYSDDQIIEMMNTISKSNSDNTKVVARNGGWLDN